MPVEVTFCSSTYKMSSMYLRRARAKALYNEIKNVKLFVNTVVESFSPSEKLSDLTLKLEHKISIQLHELIHFQPDTLVNPSRHEAEKAATEMLLRVLNTRVNISTDFAFEKNLVLEVMIKIKHLSTSSVIELKHRGYIAALQEEEEENLGIAVEPLGIGCKERNKETWYGSPDGRIRGVSPSFSEHASSEINVLGLVETDACSSNVEFKLRMKELSQMFGTAVVGSFIDHNLHSRHNTLVPTLVINATSVKVVLYDCEKDILMESEAVSLLDEYKHEVVKASTILFMWLFINHRQFLGSLPENSDLPCSTIQERLRVDGKLSNFKALVKKDNDWSSSTTFVQRISTPDVEESETFMSLPPPKA